MDVKGMFIEGKDKGPIDITAALTSAVLEWILMILLFIDGGFSYLVTKFARYFQLQVPCLLCSRLDHVLGKERSGFYWDLICCNHKLNISRLVLCHMHNNLVDVHGMCESCLFSFATVNKSNAETYRLLVGKMGAEPHIGDEDSLVDDQIRASSGIRKCFCCNEEWVSREYAQKLFHSTSFSSDAVELDAPVSVTNGPETDDTKGIENEPYISVINPLPHIEYKKVKVSSDCESEAAHSDADSASSLIREREYPTNDSSDRCLHPESQIFTVTSNFTSTKLLHPALVPDLSLLDPEIDFKGGNADTNFAAAVGHELEEVNWQPSEQKTDASAPSELITFDTNLAAAVEHEKEEINWQPSEQKTDASAPSELITFDTNSAAAVEHEKEEINWQPSEQKTDASAPSELVTFDTNSAAAVEHEVEEINWQPSKQKTDASAPSELITFDTHSAAAVEHEVEEINWQPSEQKTDVSAPSELITSDTNSAAAVEHEIEEINWQPSEQKTDASAPSELITFDVTPSSNVNENHVDVASASAGMMGKQGFKDCREVSKAGSDAIRETETELETKLVRNDTSLQTAYSFDLGDAYTLAVGNKGRQLSGKLLEQRSLKDSTRTSQDLKVLLTQLSAARYGDAILTDMSPRVSLNGDEFRISDASSSIGMQILHKMISLERNESGLSLDGSTVSEIEGESMTDRLKRQVEHDRKLMGALYKELEEERNASAVAANQAMAMITRLQEEKAALQMEALQCLRMMEEQAEYDNEALQNANDLLIEKEKEIQDLEAELELHKKKLGEMTLFEEVLEASYESNTGKQADTLRTEGSQIVPNNINADKPNIRHDEVSTSFGEENINGRSVILDFESERQHIIQCLKKLEERLHIFSKGEANLHSDNYNCEFSTEEWVEVGNPKELDNRESSRENGEMVENVHLEPSADTTSPSGDEGSTCEFPQNLQKGSGESKHAQSTDGDLELETLKNELSVLKGRLKALETEHSFLEHSINSLRNGDEGHRFIEEIAGHLRQLHLIWDQRRS